MVQRSGPFFRARVLAVLAAAVSVAFVTVGVSNSVAAGSELLPPPPGPRQSGSELATLTDAADAGTEDQAAAVAARFHHRVHIRDLDGATTTTYANPDGTQTVESSAKTIRVHRTEGWVPVDLTLAYRTDGSIAPKASPADVVLGGAGSRSLASLTIDGASVSYGWGSPLPPPSLDGPSATYRDVLPGVDLVVSVSTTGVETSFAYRDAQAVASASSISLPLAVTGLTASTTSAGVTSFLDGAGHAVVRSGAPRAWDARGGGTVSEPGAGPVAVAPSVITTGTGAAVTGSSLRTQTQASSSATEPGTEALVQTVGVPASLAQDPQTTYPLVVDPILSCQDACETLHGYIENDGYDEINSSYDGGRVHVGSFDSGTTRTRGLFAFDQGAAHGSTTEIISATLSLGEVYSYSCTARLMTVYKSAAFNSAVTWANQPAITTANSVGSSFAHGYSSSCPAAQVDFLVTGIVQDSVDETQWTYFELRAYSETDNLYWKKFQSDALLSITFNRMPGVPTAVGFQSAYPKTPTCVRGTSRPTIDPTVTSVWQAKLTDPDPGEGLWAQFEYWDLAASGTTHLVYSSPAVATNNYGKASFAGSAGTFVDGHNYGFRVHAYDGRLFSPWSSAAGVATCEFRAYENPPAAPTGLQFTNPVATCGSSPAPQMRGDRNISMKAVLADPGSGVGKQVQAVLTVKVGTSVRFAPPATPLGYGGVQSFTVPANTLHDGETFVWSVYAKLKSGKTSAAVSCTGVINNSTPESPTITSGTFGSTETPQGQLGHSGSVTITSTGATKIVWHKTADGSTPTSLTAPGACGTTNSSGDQTLCTSTGAVTITVTATTPVFTVSAYAVNAANTQSPLGSTTFKVLETTTSHAWLIDWIDPAMQPAATSVPDNFSGPDLVLPTGDTGLDGVAWTAQGDGNITQDPATWPTALTFAGSSYASTAAESAPLAIDASHDFTVAVWVRPHVLSQSTQSDVALSVNGSAVSGFLLGQWNGNWMFCMPHTQTASTSYDGDCAYVPQAANGAYLNQWALLIGSWDSTAHQIHLYVNGGAPATASHATVAAASGPLLVGGAQNGPVYPSWQGDVMNPATFTGLLNETQLGRISSCGLTEDYLIPCPELTS